MPWTWVTGKRQDVTPMPLEYLDNLCFAYTTLGHTHERMTGEFNAVDVHCVYSVSTRGACVNYFHLVFGLSQAVDSGDKQKARRDPCPVVTMPQAQAPAPSLS